MASNLSKDKGTRAENLAKEILRKYTGLNWERTPLSGALHEKHGLKSDLYIPNEKNLYCVEVKHYKDDHLNTTLFTGKNPQLFAWWDQTVRESGQVNKKPLLIFKHDRSKMFVAWEDLPNTNINHMVICIGKYQFFIALLEDFLVLESPKFIQ